MFSNVCKPCPSAGQQKPRINILRVECKPRVCIAAMMPDAKKTPRSSGNFGVKQHAEQSPLWCRPVFTFFHPDYTVGLEISSSRAGALAPACGLYRRSGIATLLVLSLTLPRRCYSVVMELYRTNLECGAEHWRGCGKWAGRVQLGRRYAGSCRHFGCCQHCAGCWLAPVSVGY